MTYDEAMAVDSNLTILFYIKPWDTNVFDNFLTFVRYIQEKEHDKSILVTVKVSKELYNAYNKNEELRVKLGLTK